MGHYRYAARLEKQALRRLDASAPGEDDTRGRILITSALTVLALQGHDAALAVLDEARALADGSNSPLLAARCDLQEAAIHATTGSWTQALDRLDDVLPSLDLLPVSEQCAALLNAGLAHLSMGAFGSARRSLEDALARARAGGLDHQVFKATHNLGCLLHVQGDLPGALAVLRQAREIDPGVNSARSDLDLAQALMDAGLVDEAEQRLQDALSTARRNAQRVEIGEVELHLALCALLRDDPAQARRYAGRATSAFRARGAVVRAEHADLVRALVDLVRGRLPPAAQRAALLPESVADPNRELADRVALEAALVTGQSELAQSLLVRASRQGTRSLPAQLHLDYLTVRLHVATGDPARAQRVLTSAARTAASQQGTSGSLELRAALAVHSRRLRALDLDRAHGRSSAVAIFTAAERWRATSLRAVPLQVEDPTDRELLSEYRRVRHELGLLADNAPRSLQDRCATLERAVVERERERSGASAGPASRAASGSSVQAALSRTQTAVVAFHIHDAHLHRIDLTGHSARRHDLGPAAQIQELVRSLTLAHHDLAHARHVPALRRIVGAAVDTRLRRADQSLLQGIPDASTVVVVPTRELLSLPWLRLGTLAGRGVIVSPSATHWLAHRESSGTGAVHVLAGPGPTLGGEEVRRVAQTWAAGGVPVHHHDGATTRDIMNGLRDVVVHIVAHGEHKQENPLLSSILTYDGPLFGHEIPSNPGAQHVVLSACEVGRAEVRPGDEPLGFAAALLARGVPSVVAAVAPLPDDAAAEAMVAYHALLARRTPAAQALSQAVAQVPQAGAFCLFGANWVLR